MLKARNRRSRKIQPGEADFIIRQIAAQGDAIGFCPNEQVFIIAALDRDWFDKLCAYGAVRR